MSCCCIKELRNKEVINVKNGCRLGFVGDVEINTITGCLVSIIVYGNGKCFGLLPSNEQIKVPWEDIKVIGEQTILVCVEASECDACESTQSSAKCNVNFFENIFRW